MTALPFVKLYTKTLDSSIWVNEDPVTCKVWITLLAMSDRDGYVYAPLVGIASRAHVSTAECRRAMERLTSPDPDSFTSEHEGRRVTLVEDGTWMVLNKRKYWDLRTPEQAAHAAAQAKYEAKKKVSAVSSDESDTEREREGDQEGDLNHPSGGGETFGLQPPEPDPPKEPRATQARPKRSRPGECSDEQWAAVVGAYEACRTKAGLPPNWGPRDNPSNRKLANRAFQEGATPEEWTLVMLHRADEILRGDDAKWSGLAHVVRRWDSERQAAIAGPRNKPRQHHQALGVIPSSFPRGPQQ